jgi:hypothetical protein
VVCWKTLGVELFVRFVVECCADSFFFRKISKQNFLHTRPNGFHIGTLVLVASQSAINTTRTQMTDRKDR